MPTLREITDYLDELYPPALAESWDSVGLIAGDPAQTVRRIHLALDPTEETVNEAIAENADLLLTHHPLLLKGIHAVTSQTSKGRALRTAIREDLAIFNAHTNADRARHGVNDALADALGLTDTRPLVPADDLRLEKIVVFVPTESAQSLIDALADAGAGAIGDYSRCAFISTGTGTFVPGEAANPAVGTRGEAEEVAESRVEMVYAASLRRGVLDALRAAHPYEEPAYDVLALQPLPTDQGLGRVGTLSTPVSLEEFGVRIANALPAAPVGVRVAGDPQREVRTVAVLGGAGDGHLSDAARAGVDAYVTADLRHHPAGEHLAEGGPALIDAGHWASESVWLPVLAELLRQRYDDVEVTVSGIVTDPWSAVYSRG